MKEFCFDNRSITTCTNQDEELLFEEMLDGVPQVIREREDGVDALTMMDSSIESVSCLY